MKTFVYKIEIDAENEAEALQRLIKGDFDASILEED